MLYLVTQSCVTLCDPMDCSLAPLSMGIFQAKILDWVSCCHPGDLPNPGIKPRSPALQADSLPAKPQEKPFFFVHYGCFIYIYMFGLNILYKNRLKSSQALMTALSLNIILFFSLLPPIHAFLICTQLLSHL